MPTLNSKIKMLKLASYTKGVPYLRDAKNPKTGEQHFKTLIKRALTDSSGLVDWFKEKDQMVSLWANWFAPMVGDSSLSGGGRITPIIKGYLNDDINEVAYAVKYGPASLDIAWFKNIWPPKDAPASPTTTTNQPTPAVDNTYRTTGMPGITITSSDNGVSRFAGFLPKVGDLGAEVYSGSLLWGTLAGPLARNMMSQLTVLGRNWWNNIGAKPDDAKALPEAVTDDTKKTTEAEGAPNSASNQDTALDSEKTPVSETNSGGKLGPEDGAGRSTVAKASSKDKGKMLTAEGAESETAPFLEGVEFAPGLVGLVGMAFFAYLPIYLRGKRRHISLRLEVVNSLTADVAWNYVMLQDGEALNVAPETVLPASQPLVTESQAFTSVDNTSHGYDFEFANDEKGKNPLQLVLNLTVAGASYAAVFDIEKKGACKSWVGQRASTDTDEQLIDRCKAGAPASSTTHGAVVIGAQVAADPRSSGPADPSAEMLYSALIHLESA